LNIVSGRAEFLLGSLHADDPRRRDLQTIIGQIDRVSGIIRALLDTVRPQKPEVRPTNLAQLLDRLLPLFGHLARKRGIEVQAKIPADLPLLQADPNQLQQLLINLLMNAIEATSEGGIVRISAEPSEIEERAGVALLVSDTGAGISPEALSKVFDPFFTTKPHGQGTGLGLAISRDIVKEHGGRISVASSVGHGTTFTVWLPAAEGVAR
jgi:signal transduction histidine kinase